jgi:two-component system, NarL family, nitrate/nitrite response regulator NarL
MKLKIVLIDDHTLFREGLETLLKRRNIDILASVADGNEGIKLAKKLNPDITLLDMRMPIVGGISVLKQLRKRNFDKPVVILTTSANEQDLLEAFHNGANGYLLKDMEPDALVAALQDINEGNTVVAPHLTPILVRFVQGETTLSSIENPFSGLTPRESEIIELIADGLSNKLIARQLDISDGTVKLHVKAILRKLQINSRVEAAVMFVQYRLSDNSSPQST